MLTTSHGIIGYLLFKNKGKKIWKYSLLGAILPDIPMLFSFVIYFIIFIITKNSEVSHNILHDQYIDRVLSPIGHSIFLWLILLLISLIIRNKLTKFKIFAISIGGISHVIIDFLTHQGKWTWNHLYPLDFQPIEGIVYYLNPYFIVTINIIWLIMFGPKIYKYFLKKFSNS